MTRAPLPPLTPELYGDGPAREPHVTVVERWAQCANLPAQDPDRLPEFLHRQLNEETNVLENAAGSLVDFPDAPWELRLQLARQCADEARHVMTYKRLLLARGGAIGRWPVMNFQYRILRMIDSLIGRLAVQNRTFEADGLDAAIFGIAEARRAGDHELADAYDAQGADEVRHVAFANEWIRALVKAEPRNLIAMARGLSQGTQAFLEVMAGGGTAVSEYGVAHAERALAGFEPGEIAVAHEIAEARRSAARAGAAKG